MLCSSLRKGGSGVLSSCLFNFLVHPGGSAPERAQGGCLVEVRASGLEMCTVDPEQEAAFLVLLGTFLLEEVSVTVVGVSVPVFLEMNMACFLGTRR